MKFDNYKSIQKIIFVLIMLLFTISCKDKEITEPKTSSPLKVILSVEVYVLDKEFKTYPQPNIEVSFHEMIKSNSEIRKEEFYTRITCSKGWVIERRNFELNENEEIFVGANADTVNSSNYIYKSISYDQLISKTESGDSVLLFYPFTIYR
jgi:hypothetical protein